MNTVESTCNGPLAVFTLTLDGLIGNCSRLVFSHEFDLPIITPKDLRMRLSHMQNHKCENGLIFECWLENGRSQADEDKSLYYFRWIDRLQTPNVWLRTLHCANSQDIKMCSNNYGKFTIFKSKINLQLMATDDYNIYYPLGTCKHKSPLTTIQWVQFN